MQLYFEPTGSLAQFALALQTLNRSDDLKAILVLGCDHNDWDTQKLSQLLRDNPLPVFGGIFPQIAYANTNYAQGTLLVGLPVTPDLAVIEGLSDPAADFDQHIEHATAAWEDLDGPATLLVLVDGLASRISSLIEGLFLYFGLDDNFIGGGAGSLSFQQRPCILTPQGVLQDVAILARLPLYSSIGVTHGWQAISEGIKVTSAQRNLIQTLDWEPAFAVYKRLVEAHSGQELREDNFFDLAKSYPFGIAKLGTEMIVRDPLKVVNGSELLCVGEVPEGCFVKLLNGTSDSLIEAAAAARDQAKDGFKQPGATAGLFIDCISRVLFLGDKITQELQAVGRETPVFGAFTLGEIANSGHDYLEFYNKTSVLGLFPTR
ncbi:FIST signal transduction protein [Thiorhodospira sibirica]|uniref:FIST signal transduction protein n=1 Tax=Thiorhodospira sibirica TaxID=154347 RepID=UPI00022C5E66|nr:FIST C-terminal domain-containing protein [Thiorhodospira sibirica]